MLADTMTTSATQRVGSSRVTHLRVCSASMPSRMSCVHTTYTPAVTTQPARAKRHPTVLPTAIATATPSATATDIRTATVSRNTVIFRDLVVTDSNPVRPTAAHQTAFPGF